VLQFTIEVPAPSATDVRKRVEWIRTRSAIAEAGTYIAALWQRMGAEEFPTGTGAYIAGVHIQHKDWNEVWVVNSAEHAAAVETGFPRFDMKTKMGAGKGKTKLGKRGQAVRVIAFRHGIPGAVTMPPMPDEVFDAVKESKPVPAAYVDTQWAGMKKIAVQGGGSMYMTFRTMSSDAPTMSWWHPGSVGVHLAERVKDAAAGVLSSNIQQAIYADLMEAGGMRWEKQE
jgi:hypothetical protein